MKLDFFEIKAKKIGKKNIKLLVEYSDYVHFHFYYVVNHSTKLNFLGTYKLTMEEISNLTLKIHTGDKKTAVVNLVLNLWKKVKEELK